MTIYRLGPWTLAVVFWSLVGSLAWAQPDSSRPRGGGGPRISLAELLSQKPVQEELKLSTEELDRLKPVAEEERGARRELRDLSDDDRRKKMRELSEANEKKISEILKPEQFKRLKEIHYQATSPWTIGNPPVASALSLTDEQKEKIEGILRETGQLMRGLLLSTDPESARKEFTKLRAIGEEKVVAVLSPEQQAKWKEMIGEPFKGEIDLSGGRGFGGGRNRN